MTATKPSSVDEYISGYPADVQPILKQVRQVIRETVPSAEETISYGIPTFKLDGRYIIYFAGYKKHISIYPVPSGEKSFEKDFANYITSGKGTIQFPLEKPMPLDLIRRIAKFRMKSLAEKTKEKTSSKTKISKAGKSA